MWPNRSTDRAVRLRRRNVLVLVCATAFLCAAAVPLAAIGDRQGRVEAPVAGAAHGAVALRTSGGSAPAVLPAVVAAVAAAHRAEPIPSGLSPSFDQLGNSPPQYDAAMDCFGRDRSRTIVTKICRVGDRSSRKLLVVMGDSHAHMWLPAILEVARRDHWAVVPLVRFGCTPAKWLGARGCGRWRDWAISRIRRLHPRVTLLGGSIAERDLPVARQGAAGVIATAQAIKRLGRVVVIGDPEGLDQNPIDCLQSRDASMARCTTTWDPSSLRAYDRVARGAKRAGVGFLATRGFVCYERQCPAVVGRTIVWQDGNHMTWAYSAGLAAAFRARFEQARR